MRPIGVLASGCSAAPRGRSRRGTAWRACRRVLAFAGHDTQHRAAATALPLPDTLAGRSIVLVGLMGAGKTSIGRRLAARLGLPFRDADAEIELAAGCTIPELFARYGEREFRDGERRVIRRLLAGDPIVLATGGGAFMDARDPRGDPRRGGVASGCAASCRPCCAGSPGRTNRPLLARRRPRRDAGSG